MALFRPVTAPQVIRAGLAVLVTGAAGASVPMGNLANQQALIAYRGPAHLAAQPQPANVAATALAVATGPAVPSARTAQPLGGTPWPSTSFVEQGGGPAVILSAAQVPRVSVALLPTAPWNYAATQPLQDAPAPLIPSLGTQIPPPPVRQWSVQPPWPYTATLLPEPTASQFSTQQVYAFSPPINPVRAPEWPYTSTMLPEPTGGMWVQSAPPVLAARVVIANVPAAWAIDTVLPAVWSLIQQPSTLLAPPVARVPAPAAPWPYAFAVPEVAASQFAVPPLSYVPPPLAAPARAALWPYSMLQEGGAAPIAAGYIGGPVVCVMRPADFAFYAVIARPIARQTAGVVPIAPPEFTHDSRLRVGAQHGGVPSERIGGASGASAARVGETFSSVRTRRGGPFKQ